MADDDIDIEAYVRQAAKVAGVKLTAENLPGVVTNFENFLALYRTVEGFDEPDAPDPAAVYRP